MEEMHVEWTLEKLEDPQFTPMIPNNFSIDEPVLTYNNGIQNRCISLKAVSTYGLIYDQYRYPNTDQEIPLTIATCPLSLGTVGMVGRWSFTGKINKAKNIILEDDKQNKVVHIKGISTQTGLPIVKKIEVRVDTLRNVMTKVSDPTYLIFKTPTVPPTIWETAPPQTIVYLISYRSVVDNHHPYKKVVILPKSNTFDCLKNGFSAYYVKFAKSLRDKEAIVRTTYLSTIDVFFPDAKLIKL